MFKHNKSGYFNIYIKRYNIKNTMRIIYSLGDRNEYLKNIYSGSS